MTRPDIKIASVAGRAALRRSTFWYALGLGAAATLLATQAADASYYYNYGYYGYQGYGYYHRQAPTTTSRRTARPTASKRVRAPREETAKKQEPAKSVKGPLTIVVSIGEQRVRVFDDTTKIAESPVSSGNRANPTPMGVFSVIQKDRYHRSNLFNDAPMPYMQRLTWSGTALHTGVLPGYAASHGCVRLPNSFAMRLWGMTKLGTRVIVARHGLQPGEISHATLDLLKYRAAEATPMAEKAAGKVATNESPVTDGTATPMPAFTQAALSQPTSVGGSAQLAPPAAKGAAVPVATPVESAPILAEAPEPTPEAAPAPASAPVKNVEASKPLKPGAVAIFISKREGKLFVRKGFEPVFDMPVKIADSDKPLGTHVFTAADIKDAATFRWIAISLPPELRSQPKATSKATSKGHRSRHEPEVAEVTSDATTASEALSRVEIPQEALDRLATIMSPGTSLTISDKGLGPQTGRGTDFIVLSR